LTPWCFTPAPKCVRESCGVRNTACTMERSQGRANRSARSPAAPCQLGGAPSGGFFGSNHLPVIVLAHSRCDIHLAFRRVRLIFLPVDELGRNQRIRTPADVSVAGELLWRRSTPVAGEKFLGEESKPLVICSLRAFHLVSCTVACSLSNPGRCRRAASPFPFLRLGVGDGRDGAAVQQWANPTFDYFG
jgi:hypothetical protein